MTHEEYWMVAEMKKMFEAGRSPETTKMVLLKTVHLIVDYYRRVMVETLKQSKAIELGLFVYEKIYTKFMNANINNKHKQYFPNPGVLYAWLLADYWLHPQLEAIQAKLDYPLQIASYIHQFQPFELTDEKRKNASIFHASPIHPRSANLKPMLISNQNNAINTYKNQNNFLFLFVSPSLSLYLCVCVVKYAYFCCKKKNEKKKNRKDEEKIDHSSGGISSYEPRLNHQTLTQLFYIFVVCFFCVSLGLFVWNFYR